MMPDHDTIQTLLDDYIDGCLAASDQAAVDEHLAGCPHCASEVASLLSLRARTLELAREIVPDRDLWPGIRARIQSPEVIDLAGRRRGGFHWSRGLGRAAAVFALVAGSSGVTAYLLRGPIGVDPVAMAPTVTNPRVSPANSGVGDGAPPTGAAAESAPAAEQAATRPPAPGTVRLAGTSTDPDGLVAFRNGTAGFAGAVEQLSARFESQRDRLSPETVKVIEQNLAIIDRAIAESRAALEKDPNDPELPLLLSGVYRRKVELLESAVQLQARS